MEVHGKSMRDIQSQGTVFDAVRSGIKEEEMRSNVKIANMKVSTKDTHTALISYYNIGAPAYVLNDKVVNVVFQKSLKWSADDLDLRRVYDLSGSEGDIKQLSSFKLKTQNRKMGNYYPQKDSLLVVNFCPHESIGEALLKDKRVNPGNISRFILQTEGTAVSVSLNTDASTYEDSVLVVTGLSKKVQPVTQVQASELDEDEQERNDVGTECDNVTSSLKKAQSYSRKYLSEKWGLVSERDDESKELRLKIRDPKQFKKQTRKSLLSQHQILLLRETDLDMMKHCGKSVGRIYCNGTDGTGFRLGTNYLMTCYHVIKDFSTLLPSNNAYVLFGNVKRDEHQQQIYIKSVVCCDKTIDFAILELNEVDQMPPPITCFGEVGTVKSLCFIGHPQGHERAYNPLCYIEVDPENKFPISFSVKDKDLVQSGVKTNYQCSFVQGGSSGSPGFDSDYKLVLMHTNAQLVQDNGNTISIVEQGVRIEFIKNYLNRLLANKCYPFGMNDESMTHLINSCFGRQDFITEEIQ